MSVLCNLREPGGHEMNWSVNAMRITRSVVIGIFLLTTLLPFMSSHEHNRLHIEKTDTVTIYGDDAHRNFTAAVFAAFRLPGYSPAQSDGIAVDPTHFTPLLSTFSYDTRGPPA
jgi:hypothetical protein